MQKDLEIRSISLIKTPEIFNEFVKLGVDSDCFVIYEELFSFIRKYYNKYNSIPAPSIITSNFPEFSYASDVKQDEIKFLAEELIKGRTQRKVIKIINEAQDTIMVDPYGAIDSTIYKLSNVRKKTRSIRSLTDKEALKRLEVILGNKEKVKKGITIGIKTGISIFDEKYMGWEPGNLIVIVGRLGVGKSWLALYLALSAYNSGKRILFISPELSVKEVEQRWDTMEGTLLGYNFPNDKLLLGEINVKKYEEFLKKISIRSDWQTVDSEMEGSFSVASVLRYVEEFDPDLVAVDGINLLEGKGIQRWEKVGDIAYGLKSIAQNKKIVVIATAQATREAKNIMPTIEQVAESDAILRAADVGIMMSQDPNLPDFRYITLPKRRTSKAINKPIKIEFSVNEGIIKI